MGLGGGYDGGGGAGRQRDRGGQRLYCFAWWGPIHGYSARRSLFTECIQWRNAAASIRMRSQIATQGRKTFLSLLLAGQHSPTIGGVRATKPFLWLSLHYITSAICKVGTLLI